jgi:hypothetical protein
MNRGESSLHILHPYLKRTFLVAGDLNVYHRAALHHTLLPTNLAGLAITLPLSNGTAPKGGPHTSDHNAEPKKSELQIHIGSGGIN